MPTAASLDLSHLNTQQPDLFRRSPRIANPKMSDEQLHIVWCKANGFTFLEIIESVGEIWDHTVPPGEPDAYLALCRASKLQKPASFPGQMVDRFIAQISPEPNSGCWLWAGAGNSHGYGRFCYKDTRWQAHRFSYELSKGPIPEGMEIDHLCRVRCCVNPDHLEAVTKLENIMRSDGPSAIAARKTHCPQGHPYSGSNLIIRNCGRRECRACKRDKDRRRRLKNSKKEDLNTVQGPVARPSNLRGMSKSPTTRTGRVRIPNPGHGHFSNHQQT